MLRNTKNTNDSQKCECPSQCEGQTYEIRISSTDLIPKISEIVTDPFQ